MPSEKFHVTDDGPKPCEASVRECQFKGQPHYSTLAEADQVYAERMKPNLFRTARGGFQMKLSETANDLLNVFAAAGLRPIVVGGSVRDQILGLDSKDVDVEVYGEGENGLSLNIRDLSKLLRRADKGFSVNEVGSSFAVLKASRDGEEFDVSLPRTEVSQGDGHKDYEIAHDSRMSFQEAASRRDFTINAIGFNPISGKVIDPHEGRLDLSARVLRNVGPAFSDDPLRPLRAINFASRFGFDIAPETLAECQKLSASFQHLPKERVREEFEKVFKRGTHCDKAFVMLRAMNWDRHLPGFDSASDLELEQWGERVNATNGATQRKAVLDDSMRRAGHKSSTELFASSLREKEVIENTSALFAAVREGSNGEVVAAHRKLFVSAARFENSRIPAYTSPSSFRNLSEVVEIPSDKLLKLPAVPAAPVLTGKALMERGFASGPEMGRLIERAQKIQDESGETNFDVLLAKALSG